MSIKHKLTATLAAAGVTALVAQGAWAGHPATGDRVFDLGDLGPGQTVINQQVAGGDFSDTYEFSLGESNLTATLWNKVADGQFVIEDLAMTLFDSLDNALFTLTGDDEFGPIALDAGDYYAVVSGETAGDHGGMYQLRFDVSPVPDAQTWLLMLGGLGLLGLGSTLRRGRSAAMPA